MGLELDHSSPLEHVMGVWEQLDYLTGQTLKTLESQEPFEVIGVSATGVQIYIYSSLKKRGIYRDEIEGAWRDLQKEGTLTSSDIAKHTKGNSVFIAAILASVPGVTFRIDPILLSISPS